MSKLGIGYFLNYPETSLIIHEGENILHVASELYEKLGNYLATLGEFAEAQGELFAKEMNHYFDLILSSLALD